MSKKVRFLTIFFFILLSILFGSWLISHDAQKRYESQFSVVIFDINGNPLSVQQNKRNHYVIELESLPNDLAALLIEKEDRFFYLHPGVNPLSTLRAVYTHFTAGSAGGASTITQQLAKNLLHTEAERNIKNKLLEVLYAISIELFETKETILLMYANTAYLGNQLQGFETASRAYFNKSLSETTYSERISLLTTLSYPSTRNPWKADNAKFAERLDTYMGSPHTFIPPAVSDGYAFQDDSFFELKTAGVMCGHTCTTTSDSVVTQAIRTILARHVEHGWSRGARNGAVVVIDPQHSTLIALVGSPDPSQDTDGSRINMAITPRPIGSTVKPFIYLKGFMEGLRPYTLVEDREYKYPIATGFSLYPKNYDGKYHGEVTLHEALSNSLNVPSVKVLEYIGLQNFYAFLDEGLSFAPIQDYENYQYGIALGGLEMDLLTLTHYFSLFPRGGTLAPLTVLKGNDADFDLPPQSHIDSLRQVAPIQYTSLVHTIISDRLTGVDQFGLTSNLNIPSISYGVKTGTSRDFHDSWVVGYTGDFVVGVWLGNVENKPLEHVSGQTGAGAIWHDVMEYLLTTKYNENTPVRTKGLVRFPIEQSDEWGLPEDVIQDHRNLLREDTLILSPHTGDTFELIEEMTIPLRARKKVTWSVNGKQIAHAQEASFSPKTAGGYEVQALDAGTNTREIVTITLTRAE